MPLISSDVRVSSIHVMEVVLVRCGKRTRRSPARRASSYTFPGSPFLQPGVILQQQSRNNHEGMHSLLPEIPCSVYISGNPAHCFPHFLSILAARAIYRSARMPGRKKYAPPRTVTKRGTASPSVEFPPLWEERKCQLGHQRPAHDCRAKDRSPHSAR